MDNSPADDSQGLRFLAGVTPIFVLGLLCFSARIISRVVPTYRLNASDYVNASAVVSIEMRGPMKGAMTVLTVRIGRNYCGTLLLRGKHPRRIWTAHPVAHVCKYC